MSTDKPMNDPEIAACESEAARQEQEYLANEKAATTKTAHEMPERDDGRFDDFVWNLGQAAGKLGCTRLRRWLWSRWQWRTNYEPFGRRKSRKLR